LPAHHRRTRPAHRRTLRRRYPILIALIIVTLAGGAGIALAQTGRSTPRPASIGLSASDRGSQRASRDLARTGPASPPSLSSPSPTVTSAAPSPVPSQVPRAAPTPAAPPPPQTKAAPNTTAPNTTAPKATAPPAARAGCTQYTGNKLVACGLLPSFGFSTSEMSPLDQMWTRESGWNTHAQNPSSGAYGIPQALPGSKMASAGSDWQTNPATQIKWGLGYIKQVYGTPSAAWSFWQSHNWY
jgi:hypothetical protein